MRLFTAIEIPEAAREHLLRVREQLPREDRISLAGRENLHITLKFLGYVPDEQLPELCANLDAGTNVREMRLRVERVECYPASGPVRVIAAGVAGDGERIAELFREIDAVCTEHGISAEGRVYRPHVTLARARRALAPRRRAEIERSGAGLLPGPEFEVREFVLMQSVLRERTEYHVIARYGIV